MPIDFARVPPRFAVPEPPRPSKLLCAALLAVVMCVGAALVVYVWPAGRTTTTAWFWFCVIVYPMFAWAFLLCCYLGYSYAQRGGAIANNRISDDEELKCHVLASVPLAVLGHAWCFSCDDHENSLNGLINGGVEVTARPSRAEPAFDVRARWLEIPEKPFYAGNELTEHARHLVVSDWLLHRLIDNVRAGLIALPAHSALRVELSLRSAINVADATARLQKLISTMAPTLRVTIDASEAHPSLFRADELHDSLKQGEARLLIAIQLRNAVSERLQDGVAETGCALLLGRRGSDRKLPADASSAYLHRPAIGALDAVNETLELALRWGAAGSANLTTVWSHGLSEELVRSIKLSPQLGDQLEWIDLGATIGNCEGAGAWVATAFAAEHASITGDPQFVLTQEGSDMVALVCRKSNE